MNPENHIEPSAWVNLIGSMGASGVAIYVMYFLTSHFTRMIVEMNQRTCDLAEKNTEVLTSNAVAMAKMADAVDRMTDVVDRLATRQRLPAVKP